LKSSLTLWLGCRRAGQSQDSNENPLPNRDEHRPISTTMARKSCYNSANYALEMGLFYR
jgi:hypothetical protein